MTPNERAYQFYHDNLERERTKRKLRARAFRETNVLQYLFNGAKNRAKDRGIEFSITYEELVVPDVCPILKTPFIRKTPYAMSLDRINPKLGYVSGNVQIISKKANVMKNDANEEELRNFAEWVITKHLNPC